MTASAALVTAIQVAMTATDAGVVLHITELIPLNEHKSAVAPTQAQRTISSGEEDSEMAAVVLVVATSLSSIFENSVKDL